jgi:hypothetical protein
LDSNDLRCRPAWTIGRPQAGLPILAGLVRRDEVQRGAASTTRSASTVDCTTDAYVWPARHQAGLNDPDCPPMGARFRRKADFDLWASRPRRGRSLGPRDGSGTGWCWPDNGSNWYFQGTRDRHWRNGLLDQLKSVPASAFEAVDVSDCMVDADSGEADCPS